jgi:hypothetical protein
MAARTTTQKRTALAGSHNAYQTSVWEADADCKRAPRAVTKGPKETLAPRELLSMPHEAVRDLASRAPRFALDLAKKGLNSRFSG